MSEAMVTIEADDPRLGPADLRLLPIYFAALSSLGLLWTCIRIKAVHSAGKIDTIGHNPSLVFAFELARLASVLALLVLSAFDAAARKTVLAEVNLAFYVGALCCALCTWNSLLC